MTVDELRERLCELVVEHSNNRKLRKQLQKDIIALDAIMERNFDAFYNINEKCYEQ